MGNPWTCGRGRGLSAILEPSGTRADGSRSALIVIQDQDPLTHAKANHGSHGTSSFPGPRRGTRAQGAQAGDRLLPPAQRPEGGPAPRSSVPRVVVCVAYHVGLQERTSGTDRVCPLLRAHDVPGNEERPQLRHPAPGDRCPVQRVHVGGHDGLLRDGLQRVPGAGPLSGGRAAGVPALGPRSSQVRHRARGRQERAAAERGQRALRAGRGDPAGPGLPQGPPVFLVGDRLDEGPELRLAGRPEGVLRRVLPSRQRHALPGGRLRHRAGEGPDRQVLRAPGRRPAARGGRGACRAGARRPRWSWPTRCKLPRIHWAWPTVAEDHPDAPALDLLATVLAGGETSRLYKTLVRDLRLAKDVSADNDTKEIAGFFTLQATAAEGKSTDEIEKVFAEEIGRLQHEPPSPAEIARVLARIETGSLRRAHHGRSAGRSRSAPGSPSTTIPSTTARSSPATSRSRRPTSSAWPRST